jgi:hypothetical protein
MKENRIRQNRNRIEFLQVSIEMSEGEVVTIDSAISTSDSLEGEANALLNQ